MGDDDTTPQQLRLPRSLLAAYQRWTEELNARRRRGRPLSRNDVFRMGLAFLLEQKPDIEAPPGAAAALGVDWDKVPLPRPWRPGDPEPPISDHYYHLHVIADADPWSTACGKRAPLSSLVPSRANCPTCLSKFPADEDEGFDGIGRTSTEAAKGGPRGAPLDPDVAQEISKADVERLAEEAGAVAPHLTPIERVGLEHLRQEFAEGRRGAGAAAPEDMPLAEGALVGPVVERIVERDGDKPARQEKPTTIVRPSSITTGIANLTPANLAAQAADRKRRDAEAREKRTGR